MMRNLITAALLILTLGLSACETLEPKPKPTPSRQEREAKEAAEQKAEHDAKVTEYNDLCAKKQNEADKESATSIAKTTKSKEPFEAILNTFAEDGARGHIVEPILPPFGKLGSELIGLGYIAYSPRCLDDEMIVDQRLSWSNKSLAPITHDGSWSQTITLFAYESRDMETVAFPDNFSQLFNYNSSTGKSLKNWSHNLDRAEILSRLGEWLQSVLSVEAVLLTEVYVESAKLVVRNYIQTALTLDIESNVAAWKAQTEWENIVDHYCGEDDDVKGQNAPAEAYVGNFLYCDFQSEGQSACTGPSGFLTRRYIGGGWKTYAVVTVFPIWLAHHWGLEEAPMWAREAGRTIVSKVENATWRNYLQSQLNKVTATP